MPTKLKIPPAWQPDKWICQHSHRHSSASSRKRISTAKLRRQIENLSIKSAEYRLSARQSKVKRLTQCQTPKSYKSFLSYASGRPLTPIHIPKMSKLSLKRWLDARDAYLGHSYPYMEEKSRRYRRRRRKRKAEYSNKDSNMLIDNDEAISILSIESCRFTVSEVTSIERQQRSSRKISHSETNLRRLGLFERIKSFVQSPVRSLSCLSNRKQHHQLKRTKIIHDHFDDKCVGTEISLKTFFRTNIEQYDQAVQVNIARSNIVLHHEYDTSMVEAEKKQRIRSVRPFIEYSDKATETDFVFNLINVEKEEREEKKVDDDDDENDKNNICRRMEQNRIDLSTEKSNVQKQDNEEQQRNLSSLSNMDKNLVKGNRIVPLLDLFQTPTKTDNDKSTMVTPTESNLSVQEQLVR